MDILLTLLVGLLIVGFIALVVVFKFDKSMSLKNIIKKDTKNKNNKE